MTRVIAPKWINLFTGSTATSAAPSLSTDGVAIPVNTRGKVVVIRLRHTTTAGNDARTATVTLYGYCPGEQTAAGAAIASTSGWDDLGESYSLSASADGNVVAFVLESPTVYDRLYAHITAISGTGCTLGCAVAFTED